jgi:AcrR family transcriptional regulator
MPCPAQMPPRARKPKEPARERILTAAGRLFYSEGIHAVGVDRIIAESGVAKATLYTHFSGKDELVAAYLAEASAAWWGTLGARMEPIADPVARALAVFDALAEWFADPGFRGDPFVNAAAEFPDPTHPARRVVSQHRHWLADVLRGLAEEAGHPEPSVCAAQLQILHDGCMVAAGLDPASGSRAASSARSAAERLMRG